MLFSKAIELLQIAVKLSPELARLVSKATSKANERARLESLKPPPAVNYVSLQYEFDRIVHSIDNLRPRLQYDQVGCVSNELEPIINQVSESVNHNSTRKTVEAAFICLQTFVSDILDGRFARDSLCMVCVLWILLAKKWLTWGAVKGQGRPKGLGTQEENRVLPGVGEMSSVSSAFWMF